MTDSALDAGRQAFARALPHVSRETLAKLDLYAELLRKWQKAINLVGPRTLDEVWTRHFLDSAQIFTLLPPDARVLVDLGSGAGFPGLVLGILGVPEVHLIESDTRKAAFLREAARTTAVPATVHAQRIERVAPFAADAVTARALAPLPDLLAWAEPFLHPATVCLFPKGQQREDELTQARTLWTMNVEAVPSLTDRSASILRLTRISRA